MVASLVGITGACGAGKSTVARHLCEGHGWREMSFADPLKEGVMHMFGLRPEQVYCDKETVDPFWGVAPRALLQVVGTELVRERLAQHLPQVAPVWVRALDRRLSALLASDPDAKVVIPDVRFEDEVEYIRARGGAIWHVSREVGGEAEASSRATCGREVEHSSERLAVEIAADADARLTNDGTLPELQRHIDQHLGKITRPE